MASCAFPRPSFVVFSLALTLAAVGCARQNAAVTAENHAEPFIRTLPQTHESVRLLGRPESVTLRSGLVMLRPGEDCGWHSTDNFEELIICLEGAGEVETERLGRRPLAAGQYAYNPPQSRHCVFNTGSADMRYVYVVAPARAE